MLYPRFQYVIVAYTPDFLLSECPILGSLLLKTRAFYLGHILVLSVGVSDFKKLTPENPGFLPQLFLIFSSCVPGFRIFTAQKADFSS